MIVRIVQLQFERSKSEWAKELVLNISSKVRSFSGCHHLEVLFDIHHPGRVVTYSHWDDELALNAYRDSEIFKTFWASIKPLFAEPAVARSMEISRRLA